MALKYRQKTVPIMDGDEQVGTVRGLAFNEIVGLIDANRPIVEALFDKFNGRDPKSIAEDEIVATGMEMIHSAPVFVAQIIAAASDAYEDYEPTEDGETPIDVIMSMPLGLQMAFLNEIGPLTFSAGGGAKKLFALALKAVQGGSQSVS